MTVAIDCKQDGCQRLLFRLNNTNQLETSLVRHKVCLVYFGTHEPKSFLSLRDSIDRSLLLNAFKRAYLTRELRNG